MPKPSIKEVRIPATADCRTVKRMIRDTFNINDEHVVLKVCMLGSVIMLSSLHLRTSIPITSDDPVLICVRRFFS